MITFNDVEDYIEYIAGYKTVTGQLTNNWFAAVYAPVLSLARYDVKIINSLATQTLQGTAYTDKQAELAAKIVTKYQRQLAALGIRVDLSDLPKFRWQLRKIDRTCRAWLDDKIYLQFPFNTDIIDYIKRERATTQGKVIFDKEKKAWEFAPTEYNISLVCQIAEQHNFTIENSLQIAMQEILEIEKQPYEIQLTKSTNQFQITNAPAPLNEYIKQSCGGFAIENFARLVDNASVLGYSVDEELVNHTHRVYGEFVAQLMLNKDSRLALPTVTPAEQIAKILDKIVEYANFCNRWPIFVHEPIPHEVNFNLKDLIKKYASPDQILLAEKIKQLKQVDSNKKFVYISKKLSVTEELVVPLLLSTIGMYYGGQKQLLLQQSQKIVYFTAEVYNKSDRAANEMTISAEF